MFFLEALTAFIIALLLTGLFVGLVGWRRPYRAGGTEPRARRPVYVECDDGKGSGMVAE
jgi:hypothetical protein